MKKPITGVLLLCVLKIAMGASIKFVCPESAAILVEKQPYDEPWRAYKYSSTIAIIGMPGDTIPLEGRGNNATFDGFRYATWTDSTILCWYGDSHDESVLTNVASLTPLVTACRFPTTTGSSPYDCTASLPESCPLVCDLRVSPE